MKKIFFLILFLLSGIVSFCDVIPDNSHPVAKCAKIINITDFPEISLLGCIEYAGGDYFETFVIQPNTCLDKGYKFNNFYILAVKNTYLRNKVIDSIDWLHDKHVLRANIHIECDGGSELNSNPVASVEEFYKIVGCTDTSVVLYKCKEVIRFIDGRPISVKLYAYEDGNVHVSNESIHTAGMENDSTLQMYPVSEIRNFIKALLLTILIETIVLFLLFKTVYRRCQIKNRLLLIAGVVLSCATLPYVWFVLPVFIKPTLIYVLISESSVILIESVFMYLLLKIDYKKAILVSTICNAASFLIGVAINMIHIS
jgi:hypothetical protein